MVVVIYKGSRGRGKTLSMTHDAYYYYKKGYKILSNYKTSFSKLIDKEFLLSLSKECNLTKVILLIDEASVYFDSRLFKNSYNINFSYFAMQIRKRKVSIFMTAQFTNLIDLRLRQQIDILATPTFYKRKCYVKTKYIDLSQIEDETKEFTKLRKNVKFFNAKPYFKMYDTNETLF